MNTLIETIKAEQIQLKETHDKIDAYFDRVIRDAWKAGRWTEKATADTKRKLLAISKKKQDLSEKMYNSKLTSKFLVILFAVCVK